MNIYFADIREWLKSLRLHKYTKLLLEYSYEEFLELTDEKLEKRNVTLGARGKIIKNIGLIKERPQNLKDLAKELEVRLLQLNIQIFLGFRILKISYWTSTKILSPKIF